MEKNFLTARRDINSVCGMDEIETLFKPLEGLTNAEIARRAAAHGYSLTARTVYNVRRRVTGPSYATRCALKDAAIDPRDAPADSARR